ncbi:pilus assembly protein [Planomonospora sp. ID67723]|uniref:TadE/TadG family type IV pilus assembly protein n=1 Tax=Planomonospora sp. ID67723 TaxID=2738134 RepID=UPI0018C3AB4A|nr:TadE family protein [Planomonospora sp. ID67723]MBG0833273.1 pilus assembly protein [Planomonospora sp. ID67723]
MSRLGVPAQPGRTRGTARARERGAASVETALMLPVILFLLFAVIDFGRMFNAQITLTEAAREGARAVALGHLAGPRVESAAQGLTPLSSTVTSCPTAPDPDADAVVEVRHSFEFITPVAGLAALFGGGLDGPITLSGRGVMPCLG